MRGSGRLKQTLQALRLVCFDLDDTLWPCWPTIEAAEAASYQFLQRHYPQISDRYTNEALYQQRLLLKQQYPQLAHDISAIRRLSLKHLALEFGFDAKKSALFENQLFEVYFSARNKVRLYDDVIPVLSGLKKHYQLAAISNGNADIQSMNNSLKEYFDHSWCAAQAGAEKPEPKIFFDVVNFFGLSAANVIHIGDDPCTDILGARNAGIASIWINRKQKKWPMDDFRPDLEIHTLDELLSFF